MQKRRRVAALQTFGVRELAPAFFTADSSAVGYTPRRVAACKSGDESPHSKLSECGSSLPLSLPLTRQRWVIRRDESRRAKAATSRRTPNFRSTPKRRFVSPRFRGTHHTNCSSTIGRSTGECCLADWYMASAHSSVGRTLASVIIGSSSASMARTMSSMTA